MLNDILIDKLRIAFNIERNWHAVTDLDALKQCLKATLSVCLPDNAYKIYKRYKYFHIEFNPTRFINSRTKNDTNLQMIPEIILKRLFDAMPFDDIYDLNIVELNLTKNYLVNNPAPEYINMLSNIKPKNQKHPIKFKRAEGESVYFSALKRDNSESEITGKKLIKFYDKNSELKYKKGKAISHVKLREQLSDEEMGLFSKYDRARRSIDLSNVNLLRLELTYRSSKNLKELATLLSGVEANRLSVALFNTHLKNGTLYSNLDKFFKQEFEKNIFYTPPPPPVDIENDIEPIGTQEDSDNNLKSFNAVLPSLVLGNNINVQSELYYIKNVLEAANMGTTINQKLRNISSGLIGHSLYVELYQEVINKKSPDVQEIEDRLYPMNIIAKAEEKLKEMGYEELEELEEEEEYNEDDFANQLLEDEDED